MIAHTFISRKLKTHVISHTLSLLQHKIYSYITYIKEAENSRYFSYIERTGPKATTSFRWD